MKTGKKYRNDRVPFQAGFTVYLNFVSLEIDPGYIQLTLFLLINIIGIPGKN